MEKREFKDRVYGALATVTGALANPHRLEIIELLAQSDFPVEEIARQTGLSVANASRHLQVLKGAQLVAISRQGNYIHYRLVNENVFRVWKALRSLGAERNAEVGRVVDEFRNSRADGAVVNIGELKKKMKWGKVTLVDVRPQGEYSKGHIPGAVSIPIDVLAKRLKEIPKSKEVVAYCRGPFCVFADEAVALLKRAGYKVSRLEEGFPDWAALGLPRGMN